MPQVFTIPWSSPVCTLRPLPTVAYCVVEEGQTVRRARTLHRPSQADVQLPAILQLKALCTSLQRLSSLRQRWNGQDSVLSVLERFSPWRQMMRPWRTPSASFTRPAIYLSTSDAGIYPIYGTAVRSTARFVSYR